jgi:hypothetical protein
LIPADRGEKTSVGVTTLLSMTVFLMVIADSMPPNSDSVPLIGKLNLDFISINPLEFYIFILSQASFYFGSMLVISLATAGTVFTLHIHKQGDYRRPLPKLIKTIFFNWIAKLFFLKIRIRNRQSKREETQAIFNSRSLDYHYSVSQTLKNRCHHNDLDLNDNFRRSSFLINKPAKNINNIYFDSDRSQTDAIRRKFNQASSMCQLCSQTLLNEQKKFVKLMRALNKNFEETKLKDDLYEYYEEIKSEWAQLAQVVDTLFIYSFVTFTLAFISAHYFFIN